MPLGSVVVFDAARHSGLVPYMAALHASCITSDKTIATFIPPLNNERLLKWWKERIAEMVVQRERVIFLLLDAEADANAPQGVTLVGLVMLALRPGSSSETGPFRASVETLLVASRFRGKGGARMLMGELEAEALRRGRTLLLLDTMSETPNTTVFHKLGFISAGSIPAFGLGPEGRPQASTIFYKHLGA
jgi:GNAT superfamily N-acetyltransferase